MMPEERFGSDYSISYRTVKICKNIQFLISAVEKYGSLC